MDPDYWLARWARNEIGFHQREINTHLQRFWHELNVPGHYSVFVPLAGKSRDMHWLRGQGHTVIGVELSALAIESFFREAGIASVSRRQGEFDRVEAPGFTILRGDFFALSANDIAIVRAAFDRGALVSFHQQVRERYVDHMARLLPAGVKTLLVAVEYDQSRVDGPPFALTETEVYRLYSPTHDIRLLHEEDVLAVSPKFRHAGLPWLLEKVYLLTRLP